MTNNEERELEKLLKEETNLAAQLKKETWSNIENELFTQPKKSSWATRITVGLGTVAAALILIIISTNVFTNDQAGELGKPDETKDVIEEPKDQNEKPSSEEVDILLEDEYDEEIQREREAEGLLEVVDMKLAVNEEDRYIVYVDKEMYEFVIDNGIGRIQFIQQLEEMYPEVGVTIQQHTNTTMDDLIAEVKENISNEDMMITEEETATYPFDAYAFTAYASADTNEWNSPVHRYYIYEVEKDVYFVFKEMTFMEAWGDSNIFDFMLETFEYVPNK